MKNFGDIVTGCLVKGRIASTQTKYVDMIKAGINKKYFELLNMRKWWFCRQQRDLIVPAKVDVTCTFTESSRIVTTAGGFDSDYKGWFIKSTGADWTYKIASIDGTGQAILSAAFCGTTGDATGRLWKAEYALWPDCEEVNTVWNDEGDVIEPVGPVVMLERMAGKPDYSGKCTIFTRAGKAAYEAPALGDFLLGYDFLSSSDNNDENMIIYPAAYESAYPLHVDYTRNPSMLIADADIPLLPKQYIHILVDGGLAEWYGDIKNWDKVNYHQALWEKSKNLLMTKDTNALQRARLVPDMRRFRDTPSFPIAWGDEWDRL